MLKNPTGYGELPPNPARQILHQPLPRQVFITVPWGGVLARRMPCDFPELDTVPEVVLSPGHDVDETLVELWKNFVPSNILPWTPSPSSQH